MLLRYSFRKEAAISQWSQFLKLREVEQQTRVPSRTQTETGKHYSLHVDDSNNRTIQAFVIISTLYQYPRITSHVNWFIFSLGWHGWWDKKSRSAIKILCNVISY